MNLNIFDVPTKIKNDYKGILWLSEFAADTILIHSQSVFVNFKYCDYIDGNLCAILGSIFEGLKERKNEISLTNVSKNIHDFLYRIKFLDYYFSPPTMDEHPSTSIPFAAFKISNEQIFENYIKNKLLNHPKLPELSKQLKTEILKGIFEIYSNALTHGNCTKVFTCGQLFSDGINRTLYFTFVDLGRTIKSNVSEFLQIPTNGINSIEWALKDGNSTKRNNHSGGLGLKVIQEFLSLNQGALNITSAEGFWESAKNKVWKETMPVAFPGTIVTLCINLNDQNNYRLSSEELPDSIF